MTSSPFPLERVYQSWGCPVWYWPLIGIVLFLLWITVSSIELADHHEDFAEAKKVEAAYVAQEVASAVQFPNGRRIPKAVHQAAAKQ